MLRYAARRLILAVPVLLGVSFLVFAWTRALPGGPAQALLGERATPEAVAAVERSYGLDRPLFVQYGKYLERVLTGDLGLSVSTQRPVLDELRERFPATVELTLAAMIFAVGLGDPPRGHRGQARPPAARPRQPRRIAGRDQHAGVLPRADPQVGVRREARLAAQHRPARRAHRPATGAPICSSSTRIIAATAPRSGTRSAT